MSAEVEWGAMNGTQFLATVSAVVVALWGFHVWMVRSDRATASLREKTMGAAMSEMEKFQRTVLVELVRENQKSLQMFTSVVEHNNEVVQTLASVTEGLQRELRYLRKRDGINESASGSDIHTKSKT